MYLEIGILITVLLYTINFIYNLIEKNRNKNDNSLKSADEDLKTRVTSIEKNYVDDLRSESKKKYVTHDEFITELREFKIDIKAQFTEFRTEVKGDISDLGKKIDNLSVDTITKEQCDEKRQNMIGLI